MDRRWVLGAILGLALHPVATLAQSQQLPYVPFDPIPDLVYVKVIVVDVSIVSDDLNLPAQLDDKLLSSKLAEFIASRFVQAGYPVACIDRRQLHDLPQGVTEADVFYAKFRIDLSIARAADKPVAVIGSASTQYQRGEFFRLLSWVPMTHFVVAGDHSILAQRAEDALWEQAQRSIVDVFVSLKQKGF